VYDELNEISSPFNVMHFPLPIEEKLPSKDLDNTEYGLSFSSTLWRVDYSLYYFNGFNDFPSYRMDQMFPPSKIEAQFLRGNMFGYDIEFVVGHWGIRVEGVYTTDLGYQRKEVLDFIEGNSYTNGLGIDRSFNDNYLNVNVLYKKIFIDGDIEEEKDEITLIANIEREFSYETKKIALFFIYNIVGKSIFLNGSISMNILENLWIELFLGIFNGEGQDTLSKFIDNDSYLIEVKYHF